jgi:hypothetical protein
MSIKRRLVMAEPLMSNSQERYLPADIVAAILGLLGCENFTGNTERIHTTLAALREQHPILRAFAYSTNDIFPFSRELENSLALLQRSRLLRMENPDFSLFVVKKGAKEYIKTQVLPRFQLDELLEVREIARKFEEACGLP